MTPYPTSYPGLLESAAEYLDSHAWAQNVFVEAPDDIDNASNYQSSVDLLRKYGSDPKCAVCAGGAIIAACTLDATFANDNELVDFFLGLIAWASDHVPDEEIRSRGSGAHRVFAWNDYTAELVKDDVVAWLRSVALEARVGLEVAAA